MTSEKFRKIEKNLNEFFKGEKEMGKLYIVATPIGNLGDITLRAIEILKNVDLIAAEDTRHTLKLLNHLEISKPLISYHRHNEETKSKILIEKIKEGQNIALVSDAGTPGICDPGYEIIKECINRNIEIIPIPGACAIINALICSGLDTSEFIFLGFLPLNKKNRKEKLEEIKKAKNTVVFYEAPHKLKATLQDLKLIVGDRQIVLAREITKIHEEFIRGNIGDIIEIADKVKGEIVIVIEKNSNIEDNEVDFTNISLEEHYELYKSQGLDKKEIIKKIAKDRKVTKNDIYKQFLDT